jgi:hypothetical protein
LAWETRASSNSKAWEAAGHPHMKLLHGL